ncbi:MAG: hypothetical protein QM762_08700 [Chryseolinea sp.]
MSPQVIERIVLAIASCVLLAAVWSQGDRHGAARVQAAWGRAQNAQQAVVVKKQVDVIATNQAEDTKADKVDTHVQEQIRIVAGSAARAAAERDSLRDQLARVRADAMSEATTRARLAAEAAAAADGLSECGSRYSAVASERDGLSVQVAGLLDLAPEVQPITSLEASHPQP